MSEKAEKCTARLIATVITKDSYRLVCDRCGFDSGELKGKPHADDFVAPLPDSEPGMNR